MIKEMTEISDPEANPSDPRTQVSTRQWREQIWRQEFPQHLRRAVLPRGQTYAVGGVHEIGHAGK